MGEQRGALTAARSAAASPGECPGSARAGEELPPPPLFSNVVWARRKGGVVHLRTELFGVSVPECMNCFKRSNGRKRQRGCSMRQGFERLKNRLFAYYQSGMPGSLIRKKIQTNKQTKTPPNPKKIPKNQKTKPTMYRRNAVNRLLVQMVACSSWMRGFHRLLEAAPVNVDIKLPVNWSTWR